VVKVFVTHNPEDLAAYYARALPELQRIADVVVNPLDRDLTTRELTDLAAGCAVIVAHRATPGETNIFSALPGLLAFLRCAVDISTVDVGTASECGVLVARADKSFVASTAELALGLYLDVSRQISSSTIDYRTGNEPPQRSGRQVRGQTAGIIGCGAIGAYLADLLTAMGLIVLVHDPNVETAYEDVDLADLLRRSDVVFPLAPGGQATTGLIAEAELAQMKRGAVLVNVSRGELLDEQAVANALDSGRLSGVGLDVGQAADQRPSLWLAARADVVATPHLGGLTPENADAQALSSVEQVQSIIAGNVPQRSVNAEHATRLHAWWAR
jgi:D-3-phosphoglycerate dehydrogenase